MIKKKLNSRSIPRALFSTADSETFIAFQQLKGLKCKTTVINSSGILAVLQLSLKYTFLPS